MPRRRAQKVEQICIQLVITDRRIKEDGNLRTPSVLLEPPLFHSAPNDFTSSLMNLTSIYISTSTKSITFRYLLGVMWIQFRCSWTVPLRSNVNISSQQRLWLPNVLLVSCILHLDLINLTKVSDGNTQSKQDRIHTCFQPLFQSTIYLILIYKSFSHIELVNEVSLTTPTLISLLGHIWLSISGPIPAHIKTKFRW